jgi:L-asparaginase
MTIQIFTTGGTIDKVYFDAKSDFKVGEPQIGQILREANVTSEFRIRRLMAKDSLDLTDEDRVRIARSVREAKAPKILITHGTDTMIRTANSLGDGGKTVVLVGSLSPARFRQSDAVFNIGFAIGALSALGPGVYVAMNGRIFDPRKVRKNRKANRFEATAPGGGSGGAGAAKSRPRG